MQRLPKKTMVVRFSSLGDVLLTTPTLRALKRWNPRGEIHFALKSEYADLLRENPNVDKIIPWDPSSGIRGFLEMTWRLRGQYDMLVDLHRSLRSILLRRLTNPPRGLKYPKGVLSRFIMIRTGWKAIAMKEPIPERYLKALEPLNIPGDDQGIDFSIPTRVGDRIDALLAERTDGIDLLTPRDTTDTNPEKLGPYLAMAPGARWPTKRWLPERFALTADILAEKFHLLPVLLGNSQDKEITHEVRKNMKQPVLDFTGELDLLETGAVIERCRMLICNDSGVMHMASALSTPIVAVFGPTTRELGFYPYRARYKVVSSEISCRPCHHMGSKRCPRGHHRCMTDVHVDDVFEAAEAVIESEILRKTVSKIK